MEWPSLVGNAAASESLAAGQMLAQPDGLAPESDMPGHRTMPDNRTNSGLWEAAILSRSLELLVSGRCFGKFLPFLLRIADSMRRKHDHPNIDLIHL